MEPRGIVRGGSEGTDDSEDGGAPAAAPGRAVAAGPEGRPAARPRAARAPTEAQLERRKAIAEVFQAARVLRAEPDFRVAERRAVLQEALSRLDDAGRRFWGSMGLWTRRRSVIDAGVAQWPEDLP